MTAPHLPGPTPPLRPAGNPPIDRTTPRPARAALTELRLAAFAGHRNTTVPLGPLTLLAGPSGSGKTNALGACEALARLGAGAALADVFPDPPACVPERARPKAGRRGFRIGCTADGPAGPVRLDLAVQAEPELRIVGERLTMGEVTLLETALRDPRRPAVRAAWHTGRAAPITHGRLPDDRLGTALLPLRVAGGTKGERLVLAAAEQMVVALRSVFACDPRPARMRAPASPAGGRLLRGCDNIADVLARTRQECGRRHARLIATLRAGCTGPVRDLRTQRLADGTVRAVLDRGDGIVSPVERLGDGELRYLALALVLLTGPAVLEVDPVAEVPAAYQALTILADGFDRCLDARQTRELTRLAAEMCERGHIRLVAAVAGASPGAAQEALGTERAAGTAPSAQPPGAGVNGAPGTAWDVDGAPGASRVTVVDLGCDRHPT
jgi:energy-coupling factor transporter ATP-binding protein EcfA2